LLKREGIDILDPSGRTHHLRRPSMQPNSHDANPSAAGAPDAGQTPSTGKLAWRTPSIEEVPFTRTEAGGTGAVYDLAVYTGSR
jgi:hypothetical protein